MQRMGPDSTFSGTNLARERLASPGAGDLILSTTPEQKKRNEGERLQQIIDSEDQDGRILPISMLFDRNKRERAQDLKKQRDNINNLSMQKSEDSPKKPNLFSTMPVAREVKLPWADDDQDDRFYVSLRSHGRKPVSKPLVSNFDQIHEQPTSESLDRGAIFEA